MFPEAKLKIDHVLRQSLYKVPLSPFIAEATSPESYDSILSIFDSLGIKPLQEIRTFGFVAGIAKPDILFNLVSHDEVSGIFADLPMFALQSPVSPLEAVLPSKIIYDIFSSSISSIINGSLMNTYDLVMQNILNASNTLTNPPQMGLTRELDSQRLPASPFMPLGAVAEQQIPAAYEIARGNPVDRVASKIEPKVGVPTTITRALLGAETAEEVGITGKGVKVAILDTGVDILHPQTPPGIEIDSAIAEELGTDQSGHGMHVLSTAVGKGTITLENVKLKGVASEADAISIKVLGKVIGTGSNSGVLKGIEIAYLKGANIISMSLGSESDQDLKQDPTLTDPTCRTIKALTEKGVMFTIAGGNSGSEERTVGTPGGTEEAITVGAVDIHGKPASFSSRGPFYGRIKPDVTSFGVDIYSGTAFAGLLDKVGDKKVDGFDILSGTSMSTPHVAGLLALVKQAAPELNTTLAKQVFQLQGSPKNTVTGWGIPTWSWFEPYLKS